MSNLTPREAADSFAIAFQGRANRIALAYGGPLYLVGSMLTSLQPGDIDLRLAIAREDLVALFGEGCAHLGEEWPPAKFLLHREELKQSRRLTRYWRRGRFDFQFQIALFDGKGQPIEMDDKPRLRLDAVPFEFFSAGRGEP